MPRHVNDSCPHYPKGVPDGHVCDARLVLVGEAPGQYEDAAGIPFVGPAGYRLREYLTHAGLARNQIYVTNVVPWRPPNNQIEAVAPALMERYVRELHDRLHHRLSDPWLIVPTGNTAFTALTGIRPRHRGDALITKWRGSILEAHVEGRRIKCIPTIHPAAALRERVLDKTCRADWKRIAEELEFRETYLPQRQLVVEPYATDVKQFKQYLIDNPDVPISFDIETDPSTGTIICCGFAYTQDFGISLSYSKHYDAIKFLCELPNPKIGQNFIYDAYWLAQVGINVANLKWDAGSMFHALDPNAGPATASKDLEDPNAGRSRIKPYSLAYMTSMFTREPYYKEDGRDEEGRFMRVNGDSGKMYQLQTYNCKDVCVTWEVCFQLRKLLRKAEKLDMYLELYAKRFKPMLRTSLHGIRMNIAEADTVRDDLLCRCLRLRAEITELAGMPLESVKVYKRCPKDWASDSPKFLPAALASQVYGSEWVRLTGKSLSNDKVKKYLKNVLKLPIRQRKGKDCTDAASLMDLRLKYPDQGGALIDKILAYRENEMLSRSVVEGKVDADGRVRCQYKNLVQTGRCSSTKNPKGTGMNLQNQAPALRRLFIPDDLVEETLAEIADEAQQLGVYE